MGWSESYWEDVRADWARLQAERRPGDEDEDLSQATLFQPADEPAVQTEAASDPAPSDER